MQQREAYLQRVPIEGKFGQDKNGYRLSQIRAKRADTSLAWINNILLVVKLLILLRIFFALCRLGVVPLLSVSTAAWVSVVRQYGGGLADDFRCRRLRPA